MILSPSAWGGGVGRIFEGNCVSEFGIGVVQVDDPTTSATTNGVVFADAGE